MLRHIRAEQSAGKTLAEFKRDVREQYYMLRLDENRAVALIPELLKGHEKEGAQWLEYVRTVATVGGPLSEEGLRRLAKVEKLFRPHPKAVRGSAHPRKDSPKEVRSDGDQ
jgi:hypothetical protein